ncbi:MAG TPA: 1-deoxy-D-xylulose-5-phosphate reductoisomerase [Burkholderiaceae bacterium]|nr:1-deoxy-D-xylulose-5-phosphate reductoisomerase [Burkholderiaceae bacterium]
MQRLCVLGATGSIGDSTLDVVMRHPGRFEVVALSAHRQVDKLCTLIEQHRPRYVGVMLAEHEQVIRSRFGPAAPRVLVGESALSDLAQLTEVDTVVAAIVGAAGMRSTWAAARAGKRILLANKEALVTGGRYMVETARRYGATLLPLDSEHNAIFQCLPPDGTTTGRTLSGVRKLWLTASGGPFRTRPADEFATITPEQAVAHPNWVMGRKISVDSASLMNKGLELIEARWLFDCAPERLDVVVHPQSVIHSMVEYEDGSFLAQLGSPDMRTPIAHALALPDRIESGVKSMDPWTLSSLSFERPDVDRFPCLRLAMDALRSGHAHCVALNAANEVAVAAFLERRLAFTGIARVVEQVIERTSTEELDSLEAIEALDNRARAIALEAMGA